MHAFRKLHNGEAKKLTVPVAAAIDGTELARVLTGWLRRTVSKPGLEIVEVSRPTAGASNETALLTIRSGGDGSDTARLVCRIQPDEHQLFLHPDAVLEGKVINAVSEMSPVRVPRVLAVDPSGEVVGVPMYIMSFVDGRVLPDIPSCHQHGWLIDASPADRAAMWDNGLHEMVRVAQIVPDHRLDFLAHSGVGRTALARLVSATRQWFDWMRGDRELDVLSRAMAYLEHNLPDHDESVLNWGDARPGNIIYDDDHDVAALIDWEMASLAPAEVDLGWWLFMDEFYSFGLGADPLPGVPDERTQIQRWQEFTGRSAKKLDYYKILAAMRFAVISARTFDRFADKGLLDPESPIFTRNPTGQILYRWLGEPVPELAPEFATLLTAYAAGQG
jgi:aminoglycoside phosphotransferase (APT) family kinase protein